MQLCACVAGGFAWHEHRTHRPICVSWNDSFVFVCFFTLFIKDLVPVWVVSTLFGLSPLHASVNTLVSLRQNLPACLLWWHSCFALLCLTSTCLFPCKALHCFLCIRAIQLAAPWPILARRWPKFDPQMSPLIKSKKKNTIRKHSWNRLLNYVKCQMFHSARLSCCEPIGCKHFHNQTEKHFKKSPLPTKSIVLHNTMPSQARLHPETQFLVSIPTVCSLGISHMYREQPRTHSISLQPISETWTWMPKQVWTWH